MLISYLDAGGRCFRLTNALPHDQALLFLAMN